MPDPNPSSHAAAGSLSTTYRRIRFIDRVIRALRPGPRRVDYWDDALPGFGLRVSPVGRKSPQRRKTWIVMYRRRGVFLLSTAGLVQAVEGDQQHYLLQEPK